MLCYCSVFIHFQCFHITKRVIELRNTSRLILHPITMLFVNWHQIILLYIKVGRIHPPIQRPRRLFYRDRPIDVTNGLDCFKIRASYNNTVAVGFLPIVRCHVALQPIILQKNARKGILCNLQKRQGLPSKNVHKVIFFSPLSRTAAPAMRP